MSNNSEPAVRPALSIVIPEPSTFALLSMGTLALLGYAWRKRRWR